MTVFDNECLAALTMFSVDPSDSCTVCSRTIKRMQFYVCQFCVQNYFAELKCKFTVTDAYLSMCPCCLRQGKTDASVLWTCICVACKVTLAKVNGSNLSFLRNLDPSPLSKDFEGDVSFILEGSNPIQAHRFILASKSRVFQKMMEQDMSEKFSGKIQITEFSAPALRAAVNFMCTAEVNFSEEVNAVELLQFAHKYEVSWLGQQCENELMRNITKENVLEMLAISYRYEAERLKDKAQKFFTANPDIHKGVLDFVFANI